MAKGAQSTTWHAMIDRVEPAEEPDRPRKASIARPRMTTGIGRRQQRQRE